jgi:putative ABC transport system permease protein
MNAFAALRSALRSLTANPMRSLLTMLGIIIGVAAVITMIAIGSGAQQRVAEQLKGLGSNSILLLPGPQAMGGVRLGAQTGQTIVEEDAIAIARNVEEVDVAAPALRWGGVQAISGGANWATNAFGVTPDFLVARGWTLIQGRGFEPSEMSGAGKVGLIGKTVATQLFGDADPIDRVVRIHKAPITIIGVLGSKGQNGLGEDQDDVVMVPISTLRNRITGAGAGRIKRVHYIYVKVRDGMSMKAAEDKMRVLLRQRHRLEPGTRDDFWIVNLTEMLKAQEESSKVMTLLLAAVAGVSLLVGGIGIMNIMLVSVTERTREIGLRMAVGARSRDILSQFLIEALVLSLVGGAVGVVLGAIGTWAVGHFAGWDVALNGGAVLLAVLFSSGVGVFFGFYPAQRASALLPIDALRHE